MGMASRLAAKRDAVIATADRMAGAATEEARRRARVDLAETLAVYESAVRHMALIDAISAIEGVE